MNVEFRVLDEALVPSRITASVLAAGDLARASAGPCGRRPSSPRRTSRSA